MEESVDGLRDLSDPLQDRLAHAYHYGHGVAADMVTAVGWYRKAAEQGHLVSQRELGAAYFRGTGVPVNTEAAVVWLRKAAERRDEAARLMLSECMRDKVSA